MEVPTWSKGSHLEAVSSLPEEEQFEVIKGVLARPLKGGGLRRSDALITRVLPLRTLTSITKH